MTAPRPYRRYGDFIEGPCERWNAGYEKDDETMNEELGITTKDARDVLGVMGMEGGWATGHFTSQLILATMHADQGNRENLRPGFPGMVAAVILYKDVDGGLEKLQEIAKG